MPYNIVEQDCKQSDGTNGSWVLEKEESGEKVSCHETKELAQMAAGFRQQDEEDDEDDG